MTTIAFKGVIAGVAYDDPAEFEKAAIACGYRLGKGRTGDWRVGTPVRIRLYDGREYFGARAATDYLEGQVWDEADDEGAVWVALEDGRYAKVSRGGFAQIVDAHGAAVEGGAGRVAA